MRWPDWRTPAFGLDQAKRSVLPAATLTDALAYGIDYTYSAATPRRGCCHEWAGFALGGVRACARDVPALDDQQHRVPTGTAEEEEEK